MASRVENSIKVFREQAGLTQQELATELGFDKTTLSKWERFAPVPDIFKLRLARRFGVPVHWLFHFDTAVEISA